MDETCKLRLTEPVEIARAIQDLIDHGARANELLDELTQHYYVDLDVYQDVLSAA